MDYRARQRQVLQQLEQMQVDALIVAGAANIRYLTGFAGEGVLVLGEQCALCSDGRFISEAEAAEVDKSVLDAPSHWQGAAECIKEAGSKRVAFEAQHVTVAALESVQKKLPDVEFVATRDIVEVLRRRKDREEVDLIRQAAHIASKAAAAALDGEISAEAENIFALDLLRRMLEMGAEGASFEPIVAVGPNSAEPHHRPGNTTILGPGPLKIDMGARYEGYCSDLTRTVYLGQPDETFRAVYPVVYEAQMRAIEAIRAGVHAKHVDSVARRVIEEAGLGDKFTHGLGHGVGLEVHEAPALGPRAEHVLEEGNVVTVEPGVYIQGWGGVRIEDLVLVTEDGVEVLTDAPKLNPESLVE